MRYSDEHVMLHTQRDTRISRFKGWVLVLVPLAAILFQVYIPLFFQFLAYLELPLIVTVYFALMRRSPIGGLLVGAIVGLAQDSLSKNPLGMFGITKTIIGYVAASVGQRLDVDHPLFRLSRKPAGHPRNRDCAMIPSSPRRESPYSSTLLSPFSSS